MDGLWPTLIAGIAGLLGAAIGGYFAKAGAIKGAQTAAAAVQHQVVQQQAHEIRQWTRQERKADYDAVLRAYGYFAALVAKYRMALKAGQDLDLLNTQLDDAYLDLALAAGGVHLLGPVEVWDAARRLEGRSRETLVAHREFAEMLHTRVDHSTAIPWHELQPEREANGAALADFSSACRRVLEGDLSAPPLPMRQS
ncbi:hypothetical protein [Streptomyces sp. NPDC059753]|uniref:hypothetical protein n=1 Tax=Streptomyces sp. NPDC059753 TaxID=3346933 RepID=UPI003663E95C